MKSIINKSKGYIAALLLGACAVSCNSDFLDRPTYGALDKETYLNTEDAGFKLLVNCYHPLLDIWTYQQIGRASCRERV